MGKYEELDEFIQDILSANPLAQPLINSKDIKIGFSENKQNGRITLDLIYLTPYARSVLPGYGNTLMKEIIDYCDNNKIDLELIAKPLQAPNQSKDDMVEPVKLEAFYSKFGFITVSPYIKDKQSSSMHRDHK